MTHYPRGALPNARKLAILRLVAPAFGIGGGSYHPCQSIGFERADVVTLARAGGWGATAAGGAILRDSLKIVVVAETRGAAEQAALAREIKLGPVRRACGREPTIHPRGAVATTSVQDVGLAPGAKTH